MVLKECLNKFSELLDIQFKKGVGATNLLPYQTRALQLQQRQQDLFICPCDKNLGPAIVEQHDYINIAMRDHLLDGHTYRRLSYADCANLKLHLEMDIKSWMKTYHKTLTRMECVFLKQGLEHNKQAFAGFYLMLNAHKLKPDQNVMHLKSQPILTCPGSLLHPLGIWTDHKIQMLPKQQELYFHNSFDLRQELCSTTYPPMAKL